MMRHKAVLLICGLLTIGALAAIVFLKPAVYRSGGSIVLLNPPAPPTVLPSEEPDTPTVNFENPYARFGDLSTVVDIAARVMDGKQIRDALLNDGVSYYEVAANRDFQRGPIVEVAVENASSELAQSGAQRVLDELQQVLIDRQTAFGTDPAYFIQTDVVETPGAGTRVVSSTLRMLIAVSALGGFMTLGLILVAEYCCRWRTGRRSRSGNSREGDGAGGDGDAVDSGQTPDSPTPAPGLEDLLARGREQPVSVPSPP